MTAAAVVRSKHIDTLTAQRDTAAAFSQRKYGVSLQQVADATLQSRETLRRWFYNKPHLFDVVCKGVAAGGGE